MIRHRPRLKALPFHKLAMLKVIDMRSQNRAVQVHVMTGAQGRGWIDQWRPDEYGAAVWLPPDEDAAAMDWGWLAGVPIWLRIHGDWPGPRETAAALAMMEQGVNNITATRFSEDGRFVRSEVYRR